MASGPYKADENFPPFRDETYRAIGRYVAEFSRMFVLIRDKMAYRLARPGERETVESAFGEMTANQLTNAFFAVCQQIGHFDEDEQKVGRWLRARVMEQIERRNDIAHGDWTVAQVVNIEPRQNISELLRIKPARASGLREVQDVSADTLDEWSDELHDLSHMVAEFGQLALGINPAGRVSDAFTLERKRVVRRG